MMLDLPTSQACFEDKIRLNCLKELCECYMNREGEGMGVGEWIDWRDDGKIRGQGRGLELVIWTKMAID